MSYAGSSRLEAAQRVFATLDKAGTGSLPLNSLAQLLTELDIVVPNDELAILEDSVDDGTGEFNLLGLSKLLDRQDEHDEVLQAFQVFDKDSKGYISIEEFPSVLVYFGIKLSPLELDQMVEVGDLGEGKLDYKLLVSQCLAADKN